MKKAFVICLSLMLALALPLVCPTRAARAEDAAFGFDQSEYNVPVGKTVKLKTIAQGIDGKLTLAWASSDESVAVVKNGGAKGVAPGAAAITCTATAKDGSSYSAVCTVNVNLPVKKLTADIKSVTLGAMPYQMNANTEQPTPYYQCRPTVTIEPSDATRQELEWSSSNPYIASVDNTGMITGRGYGKATVTGKTTDGSGKSVSVKVAVPLCYTTESSLVITDPSGAVFGYLYTPVSGINMYGMKVKGSCFDYTSEPGTVSGDEMRFLRLTPLKAGSGSISFIRNGRVIATVKVKVEKSAITPAAQPTPDEKTAVSPDFKAAMDSYEAFFDEYVTFMQKYSTSDNALSMMSDYLSMLTRYEETMKQLDAIDEDALSHADHAYYLVVMSRINQKLAQAI